MTPATAASPKHAQNDIKDEYKHLRKSDKRSNEKKSQTNRATEGNALIIIVKNVNTIKSVDKLEYGIKEHMGEKSVKSIFFRLEGGKHVGSCNVECRKPPGDIPFSKKNGKILGKCVEFSTHPKSFDGTNGPSNEELVTLGYQRRCKHCPS